MAIYNSTASPAPTVTLPMEAFALLLTKVNLTADEVRKIVREELAGHACCNHTNAPYIHWTNGCCQNVL